MLSVTDLLTINTKLKKKDITLQNIQTFYKEHLCGREFTFKLDDKTRPIVKLRFNEKDLCHLLGIHYIVGCLRNKYDYIGIKGYQKIENGTMTFDSLHTTNKKWFNSQKNRILYFPFVYQIVNNPSVIIFSKSDQNSKLDLDIILYNHMDNTYLHLGLDKDHDSDFYYPKSFFDRKKDDYITGRDELTVLDIEIKIDKKVSRIISK